MVLKSVYRFGAGVVNTDIKGQSQCPGPNLRVQKIFFKG